MLRQTSFDRHVDGVCELGTIAAESPILRGLVTDVRHQELHPKNKQTARGPNSLVYMRKIPNLLHALGQNPKEQHLTRCCRNPTGGSEGAHQAMRWCYRATVHQFDAEESRQ